MSLLRHYAGAVLGGTVPGRVAPEWQSFRRALLADSSAIEGLRVSLSSDLVKALGKNRIQAQTSMSKTMGQALESGLSQLGNSELQQSDKLERELLSHLTAVELEQKRLGAGAPTQYGLMLAVLVGGIAVSAINQLFCRRYTRASGPRL